MDRAQWIALTAAVVAALAGATSAIAALWSVVISRRERREKAREQRLDAIQKKLEGLLELAPSDLTNHYSISALSASLEVDLATLAEEDRERLQLACDVVVVSNATVESVRGALLQLAALRRGAPPLPETYSEDSPLGR